MSIMEPVVSEGVAPKVEFFQVATPDDANGKAPSVTLDPLDCSLNFLLSSDNLTGCSVANGGFQYMWAGARATVGVVMGRYYFKCHILREILPKNQMQVTASGEVDAISRCRVGVSTKACEAFFLGETRDSWGYDSEGKTIHDSNIKDYGERVAVKDEVTCMVDLAANPPTIGFARNKKPLGVAYQLDLPKDQGPVFPHVLVKNMEVRMDFGDSGSMVGEGQDEAYLEGYLPWTHALMNVTSVNMTPQKTISFTECEVLMLVGLPGSGKTTWAREYMREHPEKRYIILGNTLVEDQMRIPRIKRNQSVTAQLGKLDTLVTEVFNELLDSAAKLPRNYILDQTNVYGNARSRKLKPFMQAGFRRRAAVFVIPDEVLFRRQQKQHLEEGKFVPDQEIAEMKANFNPPLEGRWSIFNEVIYVARKPPESLKIIEDQRSNSQKWLMHNRKRSSKEIEDLPQQDIGKNAIGGMNTNEVMRMPPEPSGSGMQNRGMQDMGRGLDSFNRPGMSVGTKMGGTYSRDGNMQGPYGPGRHNRGNFPLASPKHHPMARNHHFSSPPPFDKSRMNSRHPSGSKKATGVNAIPVGPRRTPIADPGIHPMGVEHRESIGKPHTGPRYHPSGGMSRMRGEGMGPHGKQGLGGGGRRGAGMGMGNGPLAGPGMGMLRGEYGHGMESRGRSRPSQEIHPMPGGSSNGWAGDRMGDLPHNLHKKQRTKSMSYTALHGEPGPWERQFEHPHSGSHRLLRNMNSAGPHPRRLEPSKPPNIYMQKGNAVKQPPPPPRKPNQGSMMQGGRSPFTVNGLTVIPPVSPAPRRDSQRAQLHPHEHFRGVPGDNLSEDRMHQLPAQQAQPGEGMNQQSGRLMHESYAQPRLDYQWDHRHQYNAGSRDQEGQRSKSDLHMTHNSANTWPPHMMQQPMRADPSIPQGHLVSPVQQEIISRQQPPDIPNSRDHSHMPHPSAMGQDQYGIVGWNGSGVEQHSAQQVHRGAPAESAQTAGISPHLSKWESKENSAPGAIYQHLQQGTQSNSYQHTHPGAYHQSGFTPLNAGANMSAVSAVPDSGNQMAQPIFSLNDQSHAVNVHGGEPTNMKHPDTSNAHWKSPRTGEGGYAGHAHQYHVGYEGLQNPRGNAAHVDGQVQQYPGEQAALAITSPHPSRISSQQEYMQGSQQGLHAQQVQPAVDYHQGNQGATSAGPHYGDPGTVDPGVVGNMYLQHKGYMGGNEQQAGLDPYFKQKNQHQHNQPHQGYAHPSVSQPQANPLGNINIHSHMQVVDGYGQTPAAQTYGHGNHQAANISTPAPGYQSVGQPGSLQSAEGTQPYSQYQYTQGGTVQTQGNAYAGYDYSQYTQAPYTQASQAWSGYPGYDSNAYAGSGPQ